MELLRDELSAFSVWVSTDGTEIPGTTFYGAPLLCPPNPSRGRHVLL